jgi:predicted RND superfamily exporter protein
MIASHRGLQSLGRVLTIGATCCLFSSLVILPAILVWATRNRPQEEDLEPQSESTMAEAIKASRRDPAHHPGTSQHAAGRPARSSQSSALQR